MGEFGNLLVTKRRGSRNEQECKSCA